MSFQHQRLCLWTSLIYWHRRHRHLLPSLEIANRLQRVAFYHHRLLLERQERLPRKPWVL
jgi:hypothetical protein